jgi:two-component system alkaline phosphatase synthesis response regulator PhoP
MTPPPPQAVSPTAEAPRQSKIVLLCDDDQTLVGIMNHLLKRKGFAVATAADGEEALEVIRDQKPHLLLLDLAMPRRDGLGVLRALQEESGRPPYVIVLSGQENREIRQQATELGAREVWKKPFNAATLLGRIETLLAQGDL